MSATSTPSSASALGSAPATSPSPPVLAKGTASDDRKATRNEALHPHRAPGEAKRSDSNLTARTRGILCEAALFLSRKHKNSLESGVASLESKAVLFLTPDSRP